MTATQTRPRILCVDDEQNVLDGLRRTLRRRFDVVTATGGPDALGVLSERGDFAVILSDMRMPGMDGASFLRRARDVVPEATRILLTGHADATSAAKAVNEGYIFRFLSKPCPSETLMSALRDGVRQHRLVVAERELLEQTLRGSVQALVDTLALTHPHAFGRATRIKQRVTAIAKELALGDVWEMEVAALLSELGAVAVPDDVLERARRGEPLNDAEQEMMERMPQVAQKILAHIPRLDGVRTVLRTYRTARPRADAPPTGAQIMRVAAEYDDLESRAESAEEALNALTTHQHDFHPRALDALRHVLSRSPTVQVPLGELRVGMVLAGDVVGEDGIMLIARGTEVTYGLLERLRNVAPRRGVRGPIPIRGDTKP